MSDTGLLIAKFGAFELHILWIRRIEIDLCKRLQVSRMVDFQDQESMRLRERTRNTHVMV